MSMRMKPHEFILLVLNEYGGTIQGKTLLQKLTYFSALAVAPDLPQKLGYKAHYYGPYSATVDDALGRLESLGFVEESRVPYGVLGDRGFEVKRFDYELKKDGKAVAARLRETYPQESDAICSVTTTVKRAQKDLSYIDMSIAAKAYFLLRQKGGPMSSEEIREMARTFSWTINETQLEKAARLLKELGFVETSRMEGKSS